MDIYRIRGDVLTGIAVGLLIAIPFSLGYSGGEARVTLMVPPAELHLQGKTLWLPIPECAEAQLELEYGGRQISGSVVQTAYVRDQKIALFELAEELTPQEEIGVELRFVDPRGEQCVDAGPLTRTLNETLVGYGMPPAPAVHSGPGTVVRCQNLGDCANASPDVLLISGHTLFTSPYVDSLALLWAMRMGLNVAITDVANISTTSPVAIQDFIKSLYDLRCAEHFGDGHLGFVVLLGDAYEDDNVTRMVVDYDGYGGDYEASDHYYACVAGEDDFEDVMLGRIPAGNGQELMNYYAKLSSYTPVPIDTWAKSLLFMGGCFFASKADYVDLFDDLEGYVPGDFSVSRWYRYDYPLTGTGNGIACQAVVDSLNKGFLLALYSGDGDTWDWGAASERAFRSSYIPSLNNPSRLPIVISISCGNGWFDNKTQTYGDGGVDCFAERLLVAPSGGAIGCIASPRVTGGGASTTFGPEIIKSAFANGSSFLGELMLEAKTRHLMNLGSVSYVRQFNLFGDPCLNFILNQYAISLPDIVIRPYHVKVSPEFPTPGGSLSVTGVVWNASGVYIGAVDVGLYSGHPDSGGTLIDSQTLTEVYPWEQRTVTFSVGVLTPGDMKVTLVADPSSSLGEIDESNNSVEVAAYVYPCQDGFPIKVSDTVKGQVVADLDNDGEPEILVTSGASMAQAIDLSGSTLWERKDLGLAQWFEGVEPSAGDLNGDGTTECVIPIKSGVMVVEGATGITRWKNYTDYPCLSPVITDLDDDTSLEILLGTYSFTYSKIYAFDASGSRRWTYNVPGSGEKLTGMVICDAELDGKKEIVYSTDKGKLTCLTCETEPPTVAWTLTLSTQQVFSIVGGDLERDGSVEIVASHDSTMSIVDALNGGIKDQISVSPCLWSMSLGDVDKDGVLEILCGSSCGEIGEIDQGVMTLDHYVNGTPFRAPVLADLDADGSDEIIFAVEEGLIEIINLDGSDQVSPIPMKGSCVVTPIIDNIDSDANIEVVAGSIDSLLFVLDLATEGGMIEWSCAGGSAFRTGLHAQPLFGTISGNLTLSGRLDVVGDIQVPSGATLTLERCTDMRFIKDAVSPSGISPGRCEIIVDGGFVARGTHSGRIRLGPVQYPPVKNTWMGIVVKPGASASFTEAEISGAVTAIECQTQEVCISECTIKNSSIGVKVVSSDPLIDSNVFTSNDNGISASGGSPTIVNNKIMSSIYNGIILSSACNALLEANEISLTTQGNGMAVYSSTPVIRRGNRLQSSALCGIYLSNSSPSIDSCWIGYNGDCGLKVASGSAPVVSKTSIVSNRYGVGVYSNSNPVLGNIQTGQGGLNDIRQNTQYAIYNRTANRIKAQMNWWGGEPQPSMFYGQMDYSSWLTEPPAGVEDRPGETRLMQALYPNPFSQAVRLSLMVKPSDLPVTVSIYDVSGRLVKKMGSGYATGKVNLEWDGRDMFGNRAGSGTYFIAITSRSGAQSRKVVLLR